MIMLLIIMIVDEMLFLYEQVPAFISILFKACPVQGELSKHFSLYDFILLVSGVKLYQD